MRIMFFKRLIHLRNHSERVIVVEMLWGSEWAEEKCVFLADDICSFLEEIQNNDRASHLPES